MFFMIVVHAYSNFLKKSTLFFDKPSIFISFYRSEHKFSHSAAGEEEGKGMASYSF